MTEWKEGGFVVYDLQGLGWGLGGQEGLDLTAFRGENNFLLRNLDCLRIWKLWVLLKFQNEG